MFQNLCSLFEFNPCLDAFASNKSSKCNQHFSSNENALVQSWKADEVYVNPPFRLMNETIDKIQKEIKSKHVKRILLIFPLWNTATWLPKLLKIISKPIILLPQLTKNTFTNTKAECNTKHPPKWRAAAAIIQDLDSTNQPTRQPTENKHNIDATPKKIQIINTMYDCFELHATDPAHAHAHASTQNTQRAHLLQIDSGCDTHMVFDRSLFSTLKPTDTIVCFADGSYQVAKGIGTVRFSVLSEERSIVEIELTETLYVPLLQRNLISVGQLSKHDKPPSFDFSSLSLTLPDEVTRVPIIEESNLYYLQALQEITTPKLALSTTTSQDEVTINHMKFGHPGVEKARLIKKAFGIPTHDPNCTVCPLAKSTSTPFAPTLPERRAKKPLYRVHSDITPYHTVSIKGHAHLGGFKDQATGFVAVYPMKLKSDIYYKYMKFKQEHGTPKILRTDNEYNKTLFKHDLRKSSVKHELTCPYSSEQNADIEAMWRVIHQVTRTNLHSSQLPEAYWCYAAKYAVQQLNCWPRKRLPDKLQQKNNNPRHPKLTTPFQDFHGYAPRIELLQHFGCKAIVHLIPKQRSVCCRVILYVT